MRRYVQELSVLAILIAFMGSSANAQYQYPSGYGGWGGWGGGGNTVAGSTARGMGVYAAGAGAYNQQTAQARSINANTAMQVNQYMYNATMSNAANEYARRLADQARTTKAQNEIYQRLHDNPEGNDVHSGDALNVVLDELTNPKVYTQVVQKATLAVDSQLIKNIQFMYASKMISITLNDLSERGVPDELATNPAFEADRKAVRAVIAKARQEAQSTNLVSLDTLRNVRQAVNALKDKVSATLAAGTPKRIEADNFLKALLGMSKMLETPAADQFLKGLNQYPTTTLGHLITFMHSFNLRFNTAKTPTQEAAYDQLYPLLVTLRDQAQARGPSELAAQSPPTDPKVMNSFFSGMQYSDFNPQPDPHTGVVPAAPSAKPPG